MTRSLRIAAGTVLLLLPLVPALAQRLEPRPIPSRRVEAYALQSTIMSRRYDVTIGFPAEYSANPDKRYPALVATDVTPDGFRLHYYSKRPGLAPVVVGMMKGVAKIYGTGIDMKLVRGKSDGHDHDEFSVTYVPIAQAAAE